MKSGATESSFHYLAQHYQFPENVDVKRTTNEIITSTNQYKVIWAHDNCDQAGHRDLPQHVDKIDGIVCVSNWEREQYIKFKRAPAEKLFVIPNGIHEMFKLSGKPKSKTCIFFSAPHKGVAPLVPLWKEVIKHHPDAKLKVFSSMSLYGDIQPGEGDNETITGPNGLEPSPFVPVYKELKQLPGVEYSPCIDREELLEHIQDAAFYIHPNVWEETFCVSLAEAMACGCFPITTDMGALPETSNGMGRYIPMSGQNTSRGWITDDTFHKKFAEEIIGALHYFDITRDEYNEVSQQISKFAIETYNWERVAGEWENYISQLINKINVCFSTIPSRFSSLDKIIQSFQSQTLKLNKIIITIPTKYYRFSYQKEEIEAICSQYPDLVHLLYVDNDYGPATKIYGALKSLELYPNSSVMVCDDDAIYDERLLNCYLKSLETDTECVWTTAKSTEHNGNDLKLLNHNIYKLQGVDTYLFTQSILNKVNSSNFEENYIRFLQKNTDIQSLEDVFLHDDYFVSLLLYDHQIPVKSFYLKHTVYDGIPTNNQIHESLKCHSTEVKLIQKIYKNYENQNAVIRCDFTKVDGEKIGEYLVEGELNVEDYHQYIIDIHQKYGSFKIAININPENTMNALLDRKTTDINEYYDWQIKWGRMSDEHTDYLFKLKYHYRFEPKVIYDIGSNYLGWYKLASNVWKESKIYCFDAFFGFENVYPRYDIDYALELLSDSEEEVKFHENPMCPGLNSLYMVNEEYDFGKNFHNQHLNTTIRKTRTLDSVCKEKNWEKPDLIKIDVQGAEVKVLKGAQEVIKNCNHLILEVQTKEFSLGAPMLKDVEEYMQSIGFVLFTSMGSNGSACDGDYHFVRQSILPK